MTELIFYQYLNTVLNVPVYMEQPADPPADFVVLEKTGSSTANHIETATLAVQSYGGTMYQAAVLNETVKHYMDAAVALPQVSSVKLNSDYNYTDTEAKRYRYQAVFDVITLEEV